MKLLDMARTRPLTNEYKLTARTVREVWEAMSDAVMAFSRERVVSFRGRKLGNEAYINAAVWHFTSLPKDEQAKLLASYLPQLEERLGSQSTEKPPAAERQGDGIQIDGVYRETRKPEPPPARHGKRTG